MDDLSNKPWISLEQAVELGAFRSQNSMQLFLHRWNKAHPEKAILRRWGIVHRETFLTALEADAMRRTPAAKVASTYALEVGGSQK